MFVEANASRRDDSPTIVPEIWPILSRSSQKVESSGPSKLAQDVFDVASKLLLRETHQP